MTVSTEPPATERQLRYLRVLAANTATTFLTPRTRREASREIDRLRSLDTPPAHEFEARDADEELAYATAVHPSEVVGFGSSAMWRAQSPRRLATPTPTATSRAGDELARYTISGGERVLSTQRLAGCVCLIDRPASGTGCSYTVERRLELDGEPALQALIADYLRQGRELDEVPMASGAIRRMLGEVDSHV